MAKAPGGPVGDALLVSTFALSGAKKRLMLYENGISIADVSRHSSESRHRAACFFSAELAIAGANRDCRVSLIHSAITVITER